MEEKRIKVAIVDDHDTVRKTIKNYLTEMDLEVVIDVWSGNDLLEQLAACKDKPDVCLIDYSMPTMMGDELAARLREKYPSMRLAAMTGNLDINCLVKMIRNGCDTFFIKSSHPSEWRKGIDELLEKGYHYTEWMKQSLLQLIRVGSI